MVSQLRVYTINRGMMDSWLKVFQEHLVPIHKKQGIPLEATWVSADRTQFIWVRSFDSVDDIAKKEAAYFASPERKAIGDLPQQHTAKVEVSLIEQAFAS